MFTLKWDSRERGNRRDRSGGSPGQWLDIHASRRRVAVVEETLPVGDYLVFWYTTLKILIERKTWDDLAGSLKSGHLDEQLDRIANVRKETKCTVILLIEGTRRAEHAHVESRALQAKLDHVTFDDRAHVIYTASTEDTVRRIYELIDNLKVPDAPPQFAEECKTLQLSRDRGPDATQLDCFMAIPQLSINTARILIDRGWNIWSIYEADVETLAAIVYPSGAMMGAKRAQKIVAAMGERRTWTKILEQINGVTKKTAETIFNAIPDPYLWTVDTLSSIAKSEKSRVGVAVATRIVAALAYKK